MTPVRVGQKRATDSTPQAPWIRILGCYGMGSGGLLFSVSLEHTFDAIYIKSPSGLSETEILARYPHVVPPTDKEKVRLYESTIKTVASEMPVGLKGEQLQEMLSDALHVGKGD